MTQTHTLFTVSTFTTSNSTLSTASATAALDQPLRSETPRALGSNNPARAHSVWTTAWTLLALALLTLILAQPAAAIEPSLSCQDWGWVAVKEEAENPCPDPGGLWMVRHLFDDGTVSSPDDLPPLLRPYCYYEHPEAGDGTTIPELPGISEASRNCLTVSPAGDGLDDVTWSALSEQFALEAGIGETPLTDGKPVRLALLDTAATRSNEVADYPGNSLHGYTLANLATSLLCVDQDCPVQLTSRLALPYLSFDPKDGSLSDRDDVRGGYLGTQADLALAIWTETQHWLRGGGLSGQRLILNLSLGWDGDHFGGLEEDVFQMPLPAQAIHRAIEVASCRGALVIAAAGNAAGGPSEGTGPLLPAAWEQRSAPDWDTCFQLLGTAPNPEDVPVDPDPADYRPLVYAVGGVDASGGALANGRELGMPRLAAIGRHGVAESHVAGQPTATLTGTSVSTVVASSAAAMVWYYQPEIAWWEVMDRLYDTGTDLSFGADFYFETGAPGPTTRQLSICQAVEATCPGGSQCLGEEPRCLGGSPSFGTLDFSGFLTTVGQTVDGTHVGTAYPESMVVCEGEQMVYDLAMGLPVFLCPHHQLNGVALEPWLAPQPGSTPCPNCTFDDDENAMFIEIASDYLGTLTDPILIVDTTLYSLDVQPLTAGDRAVVQNLTQVVIAPGDEDKVTISFTVETGAPSPASDTSPVLVLP